MLPFSRSVRRSSTARHPLVRPVFQEGGNDGMNKDLRSQNKSKTVSVRVDEDRSVSTFVKYQSCLLVT